MQLTDKDRRGLQWISTRCAQLVTDIKVSRKYRPRSPLSPQEQAKLRALYDARDAVERLRRELLELT